MTASELQQECARRGLPSSRAAKTAMVQRLREHDEQAPAVDTQAGDVAEPDAGPEPDAGAADAPDPDHPRQSVFLKTFDAEPGGPDEETHLACRQATRQAAAEEGWQTRGDARLTATSGGRWVYEVSVRRVT